MKMTHIRPLLAICLLFFVGSFAAAEPPGWRNVLRNASFEEHNNQQRPVGWKWQTTNAKATIGADDTQAHSGRYSLKLVNHTQAAAGSHAALSQSCYVRRNRQYTLSCYVKSASPGKVWIGGGAYGNWEHKFEASVNADDWTRVTGTFTSHHQEFRFTVFVVSEDATPAVWIDDIMLEEGPHATEFTFEPSLPEHGAVLLAQAESVQPNLLDNSSFEVSDNNSPKRWSFDPRNTDSTMTVDQTVAHSGKQSLFFTNGTPFSAHVYGLLSLSGGLKVKPNTAYAMSAYVRTRGPARATLASGDKWRFRIGLPDTKGQWKRVSGTYVTGEQERQIPVLVITSAPTAGFWIDDVKFEESTQVTPYVSAEGNADAQLEVGLRPRHPAMSQQGPVPQAWAPSRFFPDRTVELNDGFWLDGTIRAPATIKTATLSVRAVGDQTGELVAASKALDLRQGAALFSFGLGLRDTSDLQATLECRLTDDSGKLLVRSELPLELITRTRVRNQLKVLQPVRDELQGRIAKLQPRGFESRALATATILEKFSEYAEEDAARGEVGRALDAVNTLIAIGRERIAECDDVLHDRRKGFAAYRYETSPIRIDGPSFFATARRSTDGQTSSRPIFFMGYGHFGAVRRDIEVFPRYGANMIQIELGPRSVLTGPETFSDSAIRHFLTVCDRAAEAGVSINLLLSPHYFPSWALKKWPHLQKFNGGFLQHDINAPESRRIIEQSLRYTIPKIKHHPAIHSFCLSNEPVCVDITQSKYGIQLWRDWLRGRYKTVAAANATWGTDFPSFDDVPALKDFDDSPITRDFVRFNQQQFADWHRWMADIIHEMAPEMPVHAKIMITSHWRRSTHGIWSVSPERFGELSQIHGNDCSKRYISPRQAEAEATPWISHWLPENMGYDFQRAMSDKPVFNSENHFIHDRNLDTIPAAHLYNVMWQGAIHGMSASTSWVWERTFDNGGGFAGSIMHRPACTEAQNLACLDLNRLANEVTALQSLRPRVVLLSSFSGVIYDPQYVDTLRDAYAAFCLSGVPVGFVTERQLEEWSSGGKLPYPLEQARLLVVPQVSPASDSVIDGVRKFADGQGTVLRIGECFTRNDFNRPRNAPPEVGRKWDASEAKQLWSQAAELLRELKLQSEVELVDESGAPAWGVELRTVEQNGRRLVNLANYRRTPLQVQLRVKGTPVTGTNLTSLTPLPALFTIEPMLPMLVEVDAPARP